MALKRERYLQAIEEKKLFISGKTGLEKGEADL